MAIVWRLLLLWVNIAQVISLKCLQCVGTSSTCRVVGKMCQSYETTCLSMSYRTQDGSNTVMKGCSSTEMCNQTSIIDTGTRSFYMTSSCCETDFCNIDRYSTAKVYSNRLQCNVCNNSISNSPTTITCSAKQSVFCDEVNNNCVDIVTTVTNGSSQTQSYIKGCGSSNIGDTCTNLYAYNTGTYQRQTYLSCCTSNLCNSAQQSVPVLNNYNGITCYGCKDNGNNECEQQNQQQVACKGTLLRCMEAFDKNRRTVMKGCSTVAYCSSTDLSQQDPSVAEIMCCAGSMCNNFTREYSSNANSTTSTTSAAIRNTDFSILSFFICLLAAIIRR